MSTEKIIYDALSWHLEDGAPGNMPPETWEAAVATHMGFYWHWLVSRGLVSAEAVKTLSPAVLDTTHKDTPGAIVALLGGELDATLLTPDAQNFTEVYYDQYMDDLDDLAADAFQDDDITLYDLPDDWEVFEAVQLILDARFDDWRENPEAGFAPLELAPEEADA